MPPCIALVAIGLVSVSRAPARLAARLQERATVAQPCTGKAALGDWRDDGPACAERALDDWCSICHELGPNRRASISTGRRRRHCAFRLRDQCSPGLERPRLYAGANGDTS